MRSARLPCGTSSSSISPARYRVFEDVRVDLARERADDPAHPPRLQQRGEPGVAVAGIVVDDGQSLAPCVIRPSPTTPTSTTRCASSAPRLGQARPPQLRLQQPARRPARGCAFRESCLTSAPGATSHRDRQAVRQGLQGPALHDHPVRDARLPPRLHLYEIETKNPADRDVLLKHLNDNGVDAKTHYLDRDPQAGRLPLGQGRARGAARRECREERPPSCISLPMFPELSQEEVDYTIQVVRAWKK